MIFPKKELSDKAQKYLEIRELLVKTNMMKTITDLRPLYPKLVREFIVNLSILFVDVNYVEY